MEYNSRNTIRLNESEFHQLIEDSVRACLNEGKVGDFLKKAGKGLKNAAIAGAVGTAGLYSLDQGIENGEKYRNNIEQQARVLNGPTDEDVKQWCIDHEMDPESEDARNQAYEVLSGQMDSTFEMQANESRKARKTISEAKLSQIIRNSIHKVLC